MFKKFYLSENDVPICTVEIENGKKTFYFAMLDNVPDFINPADTLPGKASQITKEEFLKLANPKAVAFCDRMYNR